MTFIYLIIVLTLINALFSMFEMSVAACRELRLRTWSANGNKSASLVLDLRKHPTMFIGTAQLALNVVAIFSGLYLEDGLSTPLGLWLKDYLPNDYKIISTIISVSIVTFIFLLFGDLIPKKLAMHYPELIACTIATPISKIMVITKPIISFMDFITDKLMSKLTPMDHTDGVSIEEVCMVIEQGLESGAVGKASMEIVTNTLSLDDKNITEIMIPRTEIEFISKNLNAEDSLNKIKLRPYHIYVVCESDIDTVCGTIELTDLIPVLSKEKELDWDDLVEPMHYMPETLTLQECLSDFQKNKKSIAMVINEFGEIIGMIRLSDVHNSIVNTGNTPEKAQLISKRADGSWLVSGELNIKQLKDTIECTNVLPGEDLDKYHTVNGFIMYVLKRIPIEGDIINISGLNIEVIDIDGNIVDKVLIKKE